MPTKEQLESALFNADAAGDAVGAKQLANALKAYQDPIAPIDPQKELASEYSAPERFAIGAGRSVAATGQGIKQLGLKAGEAFNMVSPEEVEAYRQDIAEEKALYDRGVGGTTAGAAGEIVGSIAQAAPAILVPGAAAPALAARVASAAGVGAVESAAQPVYEKDGFAGEKAKQAVTGAALAGAGTYGLDKLAGIMPKNLMSKFYQKAQSKGADNIAEADILEAITGISMTPAEKAGSKSLQMLENIARQSIHTADDLAAYDKKTARQGMASVNKLLREISKPRKGAETMGSEIQTAAKKAANDAISMRRAQANKDYGFAEELSGGAKIVERNNYINELKSVIDDFKGSDMEDATAIVKQATEKLSRATAKTPASTGLIVDASGKPLTSLPSAEGIVKQTVKDAINDRSFLGSASKGTGNIFKDVDKNLNRQIASRLHKAITKDLIGSEQLGDVGQALKTANTNYARNSSSIDAIEASPLGRILGKEFDDAADLINAGNFNNVAGEQVVKKIMSLHPSEIRQTMKMLNKINPETAKATQAFVLRDALERSMLPPSEGMKKGSMSFNKFKTALDKNKMDAYGLSGDEDKKIKNIVNAMGRIGDRSGLNFSNTNVARDVMSIGERMASAATGSIKAGAGLALEMVGLRRIARAMTSKEGRDALNVIVKPYQGKTKIDKALRTIERLGIATAAEEAGQSIGEE